MESAVGTVLKPVGIALELGVTWWPKVEERVAERKGIPSLRSVDLTNSWGKMWKWKAFKLKYSDTSANEDNSFRNHIR